MSEDARQLVEKILQEEYSPARVTDEDLKQTVPMFVTGSDGDDHKCGTCIFRYGSNGCILVKGDIDFKDGTCMLWKKGPASKASEVRDARAPKSAVGYEEVSGKVNCETCDAYTHKNGHGFCPLWEGRVDHGACCMAWHPKK